MHHGLATHSVSLLIVRAVVGEPGRRLEGPLLVVLALDLDVIAGLTVFDFLWVAYHVQRGKLVTWQRIVIET